MQALLRPASIPPNPVVKKKAAPKVEDPKMKELKELNQKRATALRALKRNMDKARDEMMLASRKVAKIGDKGYPKELLTFMHDKIGEVNSALPLGNKHQKSLGIH